MNRFTQDTAPKEPAATTISGAGAGPERAGIWTGPDRRTAASAASGTAPRATLSRKAGLWLVAGVLLLLFFAAAAPSPLYGVYQAQWRFSAAT